MVVFLFSALIAELTCWRKSVSLHLLRVHIDVDFSLRSSGDTYRSHTVDTGKRVSHHFVKYLVESLL